MTKNLTMSNIYNDTIMTIIGVKLVQLYLPKSYIFKITTLLRFFVQYSKTNLYSQFCL